DRLYRVVSDHLGSPLYVVNIADADDVWLDASYDEWGNVTSFKLDGVDQGDDTSAWPIPQGFAGGLFDPDTGLVRFGARDYDPRTGRWTAKDPILFEGGQGNLFVYVGNDPVGFVDISGLEATAPDWLIDLADSPGFQATGDFASGISNGATFGAANLLIDAVGLSGQQDKGSSAYAAGEYSSYVIAGARLGYAALAKGGSLVFAGNTMAHLQSAV